MDQDLYGLQASGIDPEIAAQMLGLKRKRGVAEAMLKQSMTPLGAATARNDGFPSRISPLQGIAQIVQAYMARKGLEDADTTQAGLAKQNEERTASALGDYEKQRAGTPEIANIPDAGPGDADPATSTISAKAGDPRAAIANLLAKNAWLSKNPLVQADIKKMGEQRYVVGPAGSVLWNKETGQPTAQAGFKPDRPKPPMTDYQIAQVREMIAKAEDMGMDASGMKAELQNALAGRQAINPTAPTIGLPPPANQPIPPEVMDAAKGGKPFVMTQAPGGPVVNQPVPGMPPASQRKIAEKQAFTNIDTAATQTDRENKRAFGMEGLSDAVSEARMLLQGLDPKTGKSTEKPTGSGIGKVWDSVAGVFGYTPEGAKNADRLKVVGGSLVAKVPRFEGPQSDADRKYYVEMAGQVGDDTIPLDRRLAALEQVERIWTKFERGSKGGFAPEGFAGNQRTGQIVTSGRRSTDKNDALRKEADAIIGSNN